MVNSRTFPIPVNYFSMVLGLAGLGLAWRYGASILPLPTWIGESILTFACGLWLFLIVIYGYKWIAYREQAKAELSHPILGCFVSLIPITTLLMAMALLPYSQPLGIALTAVGIIGQLFFAAYRSAGLWRGEHPQQATTPVLYLPTVATNFVSAMALSTLGYNSIAMFFLGAGMLAWLFLEPAVQQRLRNLTALPDNIRPIIGIQLAPAFVCCSAYFAVNDGEVDMLVKVLVGYGLLQLCFLIRLLPWIMAKGFSMPCWAFSFGLASMASVGLRLAHQASTVVIEWLGLAMFSFASLCIGLLVIGTLWLIGNGQFAVK